MTFSNALCESFFDGYEQGRLSGTARPQRIFSVAAVVCGVFACGFCLWSNLGGAGADRAVVIEEQVTSHVAAKGDSLRLAIANAYAELSVAMKSSVASSGGADGMIALFDSRLMGGTPRVFAKTVALVANGGQPQAPSAPSAQKMSAMAATPVGNDRTVRNAESPAPATRLQIHTASLRDGAASQVDTPAQAPTIFERLFGKPAPVTLAYAAPEDADLNDGTIVTAGRYDRQTAIYDISAHTVYLPNGTKLEAHSGLGSWMDDPNHTGERMRGATPVAMYDLKPRESLFHGVRALRLIPLDEGKVHGRSGLLAHSFMLGPNGQSNGCVSFRNYDAFLHAYLENKIKRLAVVARLN